MRIAISVKNLTKSFNNAEIFQDFSIDIEEGKITAIFGPNGCGKSTLLNILAGITEKDAGSFLINNCGKYDFSYIFQNYRESLLPWRNGFGNIALPLQIQGKSVEDIKKRIVEIRKLFNFDFSLSHYPYNLSGGQQQILAFLRALVVKPKTMLIDEPFSALDYENNLYLRKCLQEYYLSFKPTILLVTHDIEEAVYLADRIIILSQKPTKILEVVENHLLYPRDIKSLKSEEFNNIKDRVLSVFQRAISI